MQNDVLLETATRVGVAYIRPERPIEGVPIDHLVAGHFTDAVLGLATACIRFEA